MSRSDVTSHLSRGTNAVDHQFQEGNQQKPVDLTPDFIGEDRHEFVAKRAYELWEKRGRPIGSPEADWFAAEQAVYSSLLEAGLVAPSTDDPRSLAEKIYA